MPGTKIGVAEEVITPPLGVPLEGFGAREGLAEGVHDELNVRAIVVEGDDTSIAIASASVISMPQPVIDGVRQVVAERTGLAAHNIMLAATHTHSGPTVTEEYQVDLKERTIRALIAAWDSRAPGRLGVGATEVQDVARNRRRLDYGGLPVDPEVGVMRLEDAAGATKAVVFHYACHPTTLGPHNLLITEDWPHYAIQRIKQQIEADVPVMFLNGALGDLNPGYDAGLSAVAAQIPIRTWEFAEKIGTRVGEAVVQSLPEICAKDECQVRSVTGRVDLPFRDAFPTSLQEAEDAVRTAEERLAALEVQEPRPPTTVLDRARVQVFYAQQVAGKARWFYGDNRERGVEVELQSIVLDDAAFTSFPGEVFVEIGLAVKRQSPFAKTFPVGLANAGKTGGYLPTRGAFAEGDYEVYASSYREDAGDILIEATLEQLSSFC